METFISDISKVEFPGSEAISAKNIRLPILNIIQSDYPNFNQDCTISISELNSYRQKYIENYLLNEAGELTKLEQDVLQSIHNQELITSNLKEDGTGDYNFGQRLADKMATFEGVGDS